METMVMEARDKDIYKIVLDEFWMASNTSRKQ
jgi:hypothetical protein